MTNEEIIKKVSDALGVDIKKRTRKRIYVYGRCIYYKLARQNFRGMSLEYIGRFVDVDHATVIHSINNVFPIIERFEPNMLKIYMEINMQIEFETGQVNTIPATHEAAKREIANLRFRLKVAEEKYVASNKVKVFEELIERIPDEKVELVKVRLDAMIKML